MFEKELRDTLSKIILSSEERQVTVDAMEILDQIIAKMKTADQKFSEYFAGSSLTGSYLDDLKIEQADEFDIHIKIKLPYALNLTQNSDYPGIIFLEAANANTSPPKITDNFNGHIYVSREKLQNWFREIFNSIFQYNELYFYLKSGKCYRVDYPQGSRGYAVAHTFKAVDNNNPKRKISFDLVPAFEYEKKDWISDKPYPASDMPWFVVPCLIRASSLEKFTFNISAPHQERELLMDKKELKNSLRLLKAIKDNNDMWKLKSYFLKTVYLWEVEKQCDEFWNNSLGEILIHMLPCLIGYLQKRNLPFYWNSKSNLLDHINEDERREYELKLYEIFKELKNGKLNNKCPNGALENYFGF